MTPSETTPNRRRGPRPNSYGERNGMAKLTEANVLAIRKDTRLLRDVAPAYGVSEATISLIKNRKMWRHVP